jgi:hypothetical protein
MANVTSSDLYERAIGGLMKDSPLMYFAFADFEEERRKFENVKKIYDRLLAREFVDPTLVGVDINRSDNLYSKFTGLCYADEICPTDRGS